MSAKTNSTPAEHPKRMTLSGVVERLTAPRGASSSVTVKMSAQGVFMPEVTVAGGTTDEEVTTMIDQAVGAFLRLMREAGQA